MKRAIATAVATALLTSSAVAADLAVKAPPISAAPAWSWTGFYVGLNAGGVWSKLDGALALLQNNGSSTAGNAILTSAGTTRYAPTSFTGGGQLGFNYQFAPQIVGGAEVDIDYLDLSASRQTAPIARAPDPAADFSDHARVRSLATFRARGGVLAMHNLLIFATGGLALADVGYSQRIHFSQIPDTSLNQGSVSGWKAGSVVGGGFEYAFAPRWSAKFEYLYTKLGSSSFASANTFNPTYMLQHSLDASISSARFGINYRL